MHILVVFTGGTIGSLLNDGSIGVRKGQTRALLARYDERGTIPADFTTIEPLSILSENARPQDWDVIVRSVRGADLSGIDGVIVTHGTDTLAYASAALSFALADLHVPVVMVASNLPLADPRANGFQNFCDAVQLLAEVDEPSVFVTYANPDGRRLVHHGARLTDATPLSHYFRSIGGSEFGQFDGGRLKLFPAVAGPAPDGAPLPVQPDGLPYFAGSALLVRPYPGLDYSHLDLTGVDAVVHDLYHSGTACVVDEPGPLSLTRFAERCAQDGIPLFVAPWPAGSSLYESSRELIEDGVVNVASMASSAAYAKVMFGLGLRLSRDELRRFVTEQALSHEFVGESS